MLNELYDLAECLNEAQVSMASWHRHFKPCPHSTPTYLTLVDAQGRVAGLEPIRDRERIALIRKWEVGAGDSFPAFNVPPLLEGRNGRVKDRMAEFKKRTTGKNPPEARWIETRLRRLTLLSRSGWTKVEKSGKGRDEREKVHKCLTVLPSRLKETLGEPPPSLEAIAELMRRSLKLSADALFEQLQQWLMGQIQRSPEEAGEWLDLLFFHSGKTPKKVSLILELSDRSEFEYPANHVAVQSWINSRLQGVDESQRDLKTSSSAAGMDTDAYANAPTELGESFPAVRLPVLGNVILRSMSSESPCQKRYGVAEGRSYPVGQDSRQQMKNALEWIGNPDRRDKTWSDLSSLNAISSVLFAYPSEKPEVAPELAGLIVGLDSEADPDGARFDACASRVTRALRGRSSEGAATEIHVFVLMKADKARTKLLQSRRFLATHLLSSAEQWERDALNIPTLRIRQFGRKKGDKPFWADPFIPYPAEVVRCLNTAWERAGTRAVQVHGFGVGDGLGLLLERGVTLRAIAARAIRAIVRNSLSLFLALGQAHHQGVVHRLGKKYGKQALLVPSILGLFLAKLGRRKGKYMKGPPFLVGRLLSLADQLHVQYCHGVRKGQVPPQLVGNALMATSLEQPTKALAMLSQRILPYQAWARTVHGGDEVRLTKYLLGELGRVSAELKECDLPPTCDDAEKAEMLLGYLAHSEKEKDPPATTPTNKEGATT